MPILKNPGFLSWHNFTFISGFRLLNNMTNWRNFVLIPVNSRNIWYILIDWKLRHLFVEFLKKLLRVFQCYFSSSKQMFNILYSLKTKKSFICFVIAQSLYLVKLQYLVRKKHRMFSRYINSLYVYLPSRSTDNLIFGQ